MSKHSPGPWKRCGHKDDPCGSAIIRASNGFEVANSRSFLIEEYEANANLISSAPDLLAACRAAFDAIMKHCAQTGDVIWIDPPHQLGFVHESVCERLRHAIAQAEGLNVEQI